MQKGDGKFIGNVYGTCSMKRVIIMAYLNAKLQDNARDIATDTF